MGGGRRAGGAPSDVVLHRGQAPGGRAALLQRGGAHLVRRGAVAEHRAAALPGLARVPGHHFHQRPARVRRLRRSHRRPGPVEHHRARGRSPRLVVAADLHLRAAARPRVRPEPDRADAPGVDRRPGHRGLRSADHRWIFKLKCLTL